MYKISFAKIRIVPLFLALLATTPVVRSQDLIPYPQKFQRTEGSFTITPGTTIHAAPAFQAEATLLHDLLQLQTSTEKPAIDLVSDPTIKTPEAYHLSITPQKIIIRARDGAG